MSDADLVEILQHNAQGLVIVNTRTHALDLYRAAKTAGLDGLVHLTTRQYAAHRREILADVRQRLKDGRPCRLIATSLVEAGVDLDFPRVWRAEAGLDQIAQAAGRCNREGRRPLAESIVTIFQATDHKPPPEIRQLADDFSRMVEDHADDLFSPDAMCAYFREVYWRWGEELDAKRILEKFRVNLAELDFAYREVAADFRMIESGMVPVIIARDQKAREAVKNLKIENIPSGAIARELQSYVVLVPPRARARLIDDGNWHVQYIEPALRGEQFAVLMTASLYTDEAGLLWENPEYLGLENSIC